ncbi:MAG: hypothetical protein ACRYGP_24785, partial [Janthinobacterium lividum]
MPEMDLPSASESPDIPTHPLVAKLLPEIDSPTKKVVLVGYVGPSKHDDRIRLYANLSFDRYWEIPKSAVIASESASKDDENGPTIVFLAADTPVEQVAMATRTGPASFLSGPIASGSLSGGVTSRSEVACCGTLWSAGCTFPSGAAAAPQQAGANADCCGTLWTAGCTFGSGAAA